MTAPVSVLILTKNEEPDIRDCLKSISFSDDIHVLDSFSDDGTVKVATLFGGRVTQRQFDNYSAQRNYGLHKLDFKHAWVLILDADERVPSPLRQEILDFISNPTMDVVACRLRRRDFFRGRWLKHAAISPYFIRLVRPEKVHYEREINEVLKVNGLIHELAEPFDHFPFSKGISHWIKKHNMYSSMEAKLIFAGRQGGDTFSFRKALFGRDFNERRFHQKQLFYRLPLRPLLKWCYMMFIRCAFLDGRPGITYAFLQAIYEYMIVLKTKELEKESSLTPPR